MLKPEFVIFKKNNEVSITATIPVRAPRDGKFRITTKDVKSHLKSKNVKFGKCLKEDVLTNGLKSKKIAEWVFENLEKKSKRKSKARKKVKESKDVLDELTQEAEKLGMYDDKNLDLTPISGSELENLNTDAEKAIEGYINKENKDNVIDNVELYELKEDV